MADIIQDSFVETNNFRKVVFQRGRVMSDYELNELQDDLRVPAYRTMYNGVQNSLNGALNPGSNDSGFQIQGTGATNAVTVGAGYLFCDGVIIHNVTSYTLSGFVTPGSNTVDVVYLALTEAEVADPNALSSLGETTVRRQLQATVTISSGTGPSTGPGTGGVPSNTTADIWEGGVHYFLLANITRLTSAAGVISAGNVTDMRGVLPPTVISQITRQANGAVVALEAALIETPSTGAIPATAVMQIDVDPTNVETAGTRKLQVYVANRTGSGTKLVEVNDVSTASLGGFTAGQLLRGSGVVDTFVGTAAFADGNMSVGTGQGEAALPLTGTTTNGDQYLRVGDVGIAGSSIAELPSFSILRKLNGRLEITCGDGVNTFGDFNEATAVSNSSNALADAVAFVSAHASTVASAIITLKAGNYEVVTPVSLPTNIDLEIRGVSRSQTVVTISPSSGHSWLKWASAGSTGPNQFKTSNMTWQVISGYSGDVVDVLTCSSTSAAYPGAVSDVLVEDVEFIGTGMTLGNVVNGSFNRCVFTPYGASACTRAWIQLQYQTSDSAVQTFGDVVFDHCVMTAPNYSTSTAKTSYPQVSVQAGPNTGTGFTGQSIISAIVFRDCVLAQGGTTITAGALTTNPGVIDFNNYTYNATSSYGTPLLGLHVKKVLFDNCNVSASQVAGGSNPSGKCLPVLLNLRNATTNTGFTILKDVEVIGGSWRVLPPTGSLKTLGYSEAAQLLAPPFVIANSTGKARVSGAHLGFPDPYTISSGMPPQDTTAVSVGDITADAAWWFDRQGSSWTPGTGDGAFACLCGAPLLVESVRMKSMRQLQGNGDLWLVGMTNVYADDSGTGDALTVRGIGWDYLTVSVSGGTVPNARVRISNNTVSTSAFNAVIREVRGVGYPTGSTTDWVSNSNSGFIFIDSNASSQCILIEGCYLTGFTRTNTSTLSLAAAVGFNTNYSILNTTIAHCSFSGWNQGIGYSTTASGVYIDGFKVLGNNLSSNNTGLYVSSLGSGVTNSIKDMVIANNNFNGSTNYGAEVSCSWADGVTGSLQVSGNSGTGSSIADLAILNQGSSTALPVAVFGNNFGKVQAYGNAGTIVSHAPGLETGISGSTPSYTNYGGAMIFNNGKLYSPT